MQESQGQSHGHGSDDGEKEQDQSDLLRRLHGDQGFGLINRRSSRRRAAISFSEREARRLRLKSSTVKEARMVPSMTPWARVERLVSFWPAR